MSRARALAFGWTLAALATAAFAGLGTWQLARMHDKRATLDAAAAVLQARTPLSLAQALAADSVPVWVADRGRFARQRLLLDNQQRDGRVGVKVYCLFDTGTPVIEMPVTDAPEAEPRAVLVDLGWLPLDARRALPPTQCPRGEVEVRGLLTAPPAGGLRLGETLAAAGDATWLATRIEPAEIAAAWRVAALPPRVLRLDPALPLGYARDLEVLPNTLPPERHLGYAVQWFGLALAVLATVAILTFRTRSFRKRTPHETDQSRR